MTVGSPSYAVVWLEPPGPVWAGSAVQTPASLVLSGSFGPQRVRREIPYADVAAVSFVRSLEERLNGAPTLQLELRPLGRVFLATVAGAGALRELHDVLLGSLPA